MTGAETARDRMLQRWHATSARERQGLLIAATGVALALLWALGVAPALQRVRQAREQTPVLEQQLATMQALQAQATAFKAQPRLSADEALRALESSVKDRFGATAQLSVQGERATVTFKSSSADALAAWLTQARLNARALPIEARLVRSGSAGTLWDGSMVLRLPTP